MKPMKFFASPDEDPALPIHPGDWRWRCAAFAGWCLLLAAAFLRPLWDLAQLATTDLHSHAFLIPCISAYLIYVERHRLPRQVD